MIRKQYPLCLGFALELFIFLISSVNTVCMVWNVRNTYKNKYFTTEPGNEHVVPTLFHLPWGMVDYWLLTAEVQGRVEGGQMYPNSKQAHRPTTSECYVEVHPHIFFTWGQIFEILLWRLHQKIEIMHTGCLLKISRCQTLKLYALVMKPLSSFWYLVVTESIAWLEAEFKLFTIQLILDNYIEPSMQSCSWCNPWGSQCNLQYI